MNKKMNTLSVKKDDNVLDINLLLKKIYSDQIANLDLSNMSIPDYTQTPEIIVSKGVKKHDTVYSPMICISNNRVVTAYRKVLYFWNTDDLSLVDVINTKNRICGMLELPDGSLLTDHDDLTLKRWHFNTSKLSEILLTHHKNICSWTCLPNNIVALGSDKGDLELRHLDTMRLISPVIQGRKSKIYHLAYQNCSHLISIDSEFYLIRWYLDALTLDSMTKLEFEACSLAIYSDGNIFLGDDHGNIYCYDYSSRNAKTSFKICDRPVWILKILPDNNLIAIDSESTITIIDKTMNRIAKSILLSYYDVYCSNISNIAILPNGDIILCSKCMGEHKIISLKFPTRAL